MDNPEVLLEKSSSRKSSTNKRKPRSDSAMAERFNAYRIMWLFVFFDLPSVTKKEKKEYQKFHKFLLKDGFSMFQYSVYYRFCGSLESSEAYTRRVEDSLPKLGKVSIMRVTDKQFGMIKNFWGQKPRASESPPAQVEMF